MEKIERSHIISAIEEIDRAGRTDQTSFRFELLFNDKQYPPLLVVAIANRLAGGVELPPNSSNGGWKSEEFALLKKYGFRVVEKTKESDKAALSIELNKIASKPEAEIFFKLLSDLLVGLEIYSDDERLAITARGSGKNRISVDINARLVLSLERANGVSQISFMVPNAVADIHAKEWVGEKWRFKGGDELVSVNVNTKDCQNLSENFKIAWLETCKDYLPSQQKSQYRQHHNEGLYRLAFDAHLLNSLFLKMDLTMDSKSMNYQETIQLYPIAKQFHDFMAQFHRTPGTPKEYVTWLNKVSTWFKENGIVSKSFDIWTDISEIDSIERNLNTVSKAKWKNLNNDNNNWYSAPWNKWVKFNKDVIGQSNTPLIQFEIDLNFDCSAFHKALLTASLSIQEALSYRFVGSLLAKPFLILTGLSGSGKTKLAQAFAQWICASENQYRVVPVGADWTTREPLFGYPNALEQGKYVRPESGVLDVILLAIKNPKLPHFLILDEMNLSHVERYFADFLSGLESGEELPLHSGNGEMDGVPAKLKLPKNLYIIGTVNIDETTYMFSPKVLDRANVIEFRVSAEEMTGFLANPVKPDLDQLRGKGAGMAEGFVTLSQQTTAYVEKEDLNAALLLFFGELKKCGAEFGYRSANEIHGLAAKLKELNPAITVHEVVDIALMQKLLPKVHGSRKKMETILKVLASLCAEATVETGKLLDTKEFAMPEQGVKYPLAFEKLWRMYRGAVDNGFTSYAEA